MAFKLLQKVMDNNNAVDQAANAQQQPVLRARRPRMVYTGMWIRDGYLTRDDNGHWMREGRLIKKYYKD